MSEIIYIPFPEEAPAFDLRAAARAAWEVAQVEQAAREEEARQAAALRHAERLTYFGRALAEVGIPAQPTDIPFILDGITLGYEYDHHSQYRPALARHCTECHAFQYYTTFKTLAELHKQLQEILVCEECALAAVPLVSAPPRRPLPPSLEDQLLSALRTWVRAQVADEVARWEETPHG